MTQLSLLSGLDADPKAPRQKRMGSIEARHWPRNNPSEGWRQEDRGWIRDAQTLPLLIGVDEAGRGPLAGPVSVAAVVLDPGVMSREADQAWLAELDDSKKLTESTRNRLFGTIMDRSVAWAIAHIHADRIDEVNILQATFQGMCLSVELALGIEDPDWDRPEAVRGQTREELGEAEGQIASWYCGDLSPESPPKGADLLWSSPIKVGDRPKVTVLVDGHKPFRVQGARASRLSQTPVVKGDALSLHIAAASVLAKVSRDKVMAHFDELWPGYGFGGHKGYPTAAHRAAIETQGPCGVHRMTFAPIAKK